MSLVAFGHAFYQRQEMSFASIGLRERAIAFLLGVVFVLVAVWDIKAGSSSFFFAKSPTWLCFDRDDHPVLFWICVFSWLVAGFGVMVLVCIT